MKMMTPRVNFAKLPLEERLVRKEWKARIHGYEEAIKIFRTIKDQKSPEWEKYLGLIKNFVSDNNIAALKKGLEAALAFIENAEIAEKTAEDIMPIIVSHCIGNSRSTIQLLAVKISLMYIEIEKHELVVEELIMGAEHKNPKIAVACISTLAQALNEFGLEVINMDLIFKAIPTLLKVKHKNVRDETKVLIVQIYRWIGYAVKVHLINLKRIQVQELEAEFDKIKSSNRIYTPTRYLKSQQIKPIEVADPEAE